MKWGKKANLLTVTNLPNGYLHLCDVFEMKTCRWRADKRLPGVRGRLGRVLTVLELFSTLTKVMGA